METLVLIAVESQPELACQIVHIYQVYMFTISIKYSDMSEIITLLN